MNNQNEFNDWVRFSGSMEAEPLPWPAIWRKVPSLTSVKCTAVGVLFEYSLTGTRSWRALG